VTQKKLKLICWFLPILRTYTNEGGAKEYPLHLAVHPHMLREMVRDEIKLLRELEGGGIDIDSQESP
jgi:hypothetical protein